MNSTVLSRTIEAAGVAAFALTFCFIGLDALGQLTGLDLLLISAAAASLGMVLGSFARSPSQFASATWQRLVFMVWTPVAVLMMLLLLVFRIGFLMFKISLKLIIWVVGGIAYFLMPIDLVPDFLIGLGQIDDIVVIISLAVWAFSSAAMDGLRGSIGSRRPTVGFP